MDDRWVRVDGKGKWHLSKYSVDVEGAGETVCGRSGHLVPGKPGWEPQSGSKHSECRRYVEDHTS